MTMCCYLQQQTRHRWRRQSGANGNALEDVIMLMNCLRPMVEKSVVKKLLGGFEKLQSRFSCWFCFLLCLLLFRFSNNLISAAV